MAEMTIIVEFETLEGAEPEFTRIMTDHARRTRAEEPGCIRYEVIKPLDEDGAAMPNRVIVNKVYADRDAIDAHNANPRLPPLRNAIEPLLKSRRLVVGRAIAERPMDEGLTPAELNAANDD